MLLRKKHRHDKLSRYSARTRDVKLRKTLGFGRKHARAMRPSTFPVSTRPHLTALWRFLCVHQSASACSSPREEKREGESRFERMQKSVWRKRVNGDAVVKERRNAARSQHQSETRWWVVWLQPSAHAECTEAAGNGLWSMVTARVHEHERKDLA